MAWALVGAAAVSTVGGALLGGKAGGSAQGGTQTVNKDPWLAAQPWLKQNLATGQALQNQYAANPFNAQQQSAYSNLASGNDYINRLTPSLLNQFSQQTGFDRNNPMAKPQAYNFNAPSYNPQMAQMFGGQMQPSMPAPQKPMMFQANATPSTPTGMAGPTQAQQDADIAMDYRRQHGIGEFAGNLQNQG